MASLADTISYYRLIEQTREWPIDAINLLRFAFYLVIGLLRAVQEIFQVPLMVPGYLVA